MNNLVIRVVKKAVGVFISEMDGGREEESSVKKCAGFILAVISKMQPIYKYGILTIIFYFNFVSLISRGRSFMNLSLPDRVKIINKWSKSRLGLKRDFIKLLLNLVVIAYYDSENVLKKNGINMDDYLKIQRLYNG